MTRSASPREAAAIRRNAERVAAIKAEVAEERAEVRVLAKPRGGRR